MVATSAGATYPGLPLGGFFLDGNDARSEIFGYIVFAYIESYYNAHRRHSSLDNKTPDQFEARFHSLN